MFDQKGTCNDSFVRVNNGHTDVSLYGVLSEKGEAVLFIIDYTLLLSISHQSITATSVSLPGCSRCVTIVPSLTSQPVRFSVYALPWKLAYSFCPWLFAPFVPLSEIEQKPHAAVRCMSKWH